MPEPIERRLRRVEASTQPRIPVSRIALSRTSFDGEIQFTSQRNAPFRYQVKDGALVKSFFAGESLLIDGSNRMLSGAIIYCDEVRALSASGLYLRDDSGTGGIHIEDAGQIMFYDQNGNEAMGIDAGVASAVNYITFENSATTDPVHVQAIGDDTNIGIRLHTKGTGALSVKFATTEVLSYTSGAFAFQQATTISTTAGALTLSPTGALVLGGGAAAADTDDTVLILNGSGEVRTDEIDTRVWGSSLVDYTGTPADNYIAVFTDVDTIEGDANFTWDASTLLVKGGANSITSIFRANATGSANIAEWQDSTTAILASVDQGGNIYGQNFQVPDGGTVGYSGGPIWTFDDTGGDISTLYPVGFGTVSPASPIETYRVDTGTHITFDRNGTDVVTLAAASNALRVDTVAGGAILLNYGQLDVDTYIRWDTGNALFARGSDGFVGLQHTAPLASFDVVGTTRLGDSTTNYTSVEADGDVLFVGGGGLHFGEIYVVGNANASVLNSAAKVQFVHFDTDGVSNGNITPAHGQDHITIGVEGMYLVAVHMHIQNNAAQSHVIAAGAWYNNGDTAIPQVHCHSNLTGGVTDVISMSYTGIADLPAGATLEVWLNTGDAADRSVTVVDCALTAIQVGGT